MLSKATEAMQKIFGFPAFYPAQERAIQSILDARDTLVVMPTGGGKSLCYQIPALLREGVTLVISPLIALMKDQVDALERRGIAATYINSSLEGREVSARLRALARGDYKLVYVAPERVRNRAFNEALAGIQIGLFAVDEAHCISQWGHDFRPDYMRLRPVIEQLGRPQVVAFTATATREVRVDIRTHLGMRNPQEFVAGFSRPNLSLVVRQVGSESEKEDRLRAIIQAHKTGIVYCATRKRVELIAALLQHAGIPVTSYHGGMRDEERAAAQKKFTDRTADVVVATNAFGMGIDRADVRFVVHYEVPGSIEAYYQEAGRAGRDGQPAHCELLFNFADTRVQEFFLEGANPGPQLIRRVFDFVNKHSDNHHELVLSVAEMTEKIPGVNNDMAVGAALAYLSRAGYLDRFDVPGRMTRGTRVLQPDLKGAQIPIDEAALQEKERRDRAKLQAMIHFAYGQRCRQWLILDYFGEADAKPCGLCDICRERASTGERAPTPDEDLLVRKILSCAARMSRKTADGSWEGRFGRMRLVQVLTGQRSEQVLKARLEELTTFGILQDQDPQHLNRMLDTLEEAGMLSVGPEPYRLVTLTALGEQVMRSQTEYRLLWPSVYGERRSARKPKKQRGASKLARGIVPDDAEMYEKLKKRRLEISRRTGTPLNRILSEEALRSLARLKPATPEAALRIRGIGPEKAKNILPLLLDVIRKG